MNQVRECTESPGWASRQPVYTIMALVMALLSVLLAAYHRYAAAWTPLERFYLTEYLRSGLMARVGVKAGRYELLIVVNRKEGRLALDDEVTPAHSSEENRFALSQEAVEHGALRLDWERAEYDNAKLHALLGHWIYHDQTLLDLARWPLGRGLGMLVVGLVFAIPKDRTRARELRSGRRLRGPELVTVGAFNRRNRPPGIGFVNLERGFAERLLGWSSRVEVRRERESSHFLIMGDTGADKSALIRQILTQIEERGETAIVYDPEREYTPQFYKPERQDAILNPLDARMPYWSPGDEVRNEPEALTIAASLFPDQPNEQRFSTTGLKEMFVHLLSCNPTPKQLAGWMSHEEEIDRRVCGIEAASVIAAKAPEERQGEMAELKKVAKALALLPSEKETKRRWSTLEWSKGRRGWIFLTSTNTTLERLLPLTSLWLDLLVLRLMEEGIGDYNRARPRVWIVLDELPSLQKLPQLHAAITRNAKSDHPVVLACGGRSQLEALYGPEAETLLSQPATKIFLRTNEPQAAKWISETIGQVEIELWRERDTSGYFPGDRKSTKYQLERRVEPLVMASEIMRLPARQGYLKSGNLVVRLNFPYIDWPETQPGLIQRTINWQLNQEPSVSVSGQVGDGAPLRHEQRQTQQQTKQAADGEQSPFFE